MVHANPPIMGTTVSATKAPGHWVLARLGKKVLRPGGLGLTRRMLSSLNISSGDDVVEFAPGLGITARLTLAHHPRSYTAVERDEQAAVSVRRILTGDAQRCIVGRAEETGLPDSSASVVYGEAMLTMQTPTAKARIVGEAARLLRSGGRYAIHEIAFKSDVVTPALAEEIRSALGSAIHHNVMPLPVGEWRALLESQGFSIGAEHLAPMHLLEPGRLISDEGWAGAMKFAWNLARDGESRQRVLVMRRVFRTYEPYITAVSLMGVKPV